MNQITKIPNRIKRLFWDVNKDEVDPELHKSFIIRRIVNHGDMDDVRWMLNIYSKDEIIHVIKKSKGISRKSAFFWATYFNIPTEDVICLKKSSPQM
jgi:hypothetical protein